MDFQPFIFKAYVIEIESPKSYFVKGVMTCKTLTDLLVAKPVMLHLFSLPERKLKTVVLIVVSSN